MLLQLLVKLYKSSIIPILNGAYYYGFIKMVW